jgi:hypothetical protein
VLGDLLTVSKRGFDNTRFVDCIFGAALREPKNAKMLEAELRRGLKMLETRPPEGVVGADCVAARGELSGSGRVDGSS